MKADEYLLEKLQRRVEKNYQAFKRDMLNLPKKELFDKAAYITATNDIHHFLMDDQQLDIDVISYYLSFKNPLKLIADRIDNSEYSPNINDYILDTMEEQANSHDFLDGKVYALSKDGKSMDMER